LNLERIFIDESYMSVYVYSIIKASKNQQS